MRPHLPLAMALALPLACAPGTYEVRLRFKNDPSGHDAPTAGPDVAAALARSSACDVLSEPLEITIK